MAEKKIKAKVVLSKCPKVKENEGLFGIRIQKKKKDWIRTWAFKIDPRKASREGYDEETVTGSFQATDDYPGCPYCHTKSFVLCGYCDRLFCWNGKKEVTCPWCKSRAGVKDSDSFDVSGGGF